MKTLLKLAVCLLACTGLSFAADKEMTKKDHIMMKDGKMMCMKDGKVAMMDKDMTLENGTMVKTDGTVMMKGGDKMMLKEGEAIDMMGMKMKHGKKDKEAKKEGTTGTEAVKKTGEKK